MKHGKEERREEKRGEDGAQAQPRCAESGQLGGAAEALKKEERGDEGGDGDSHGEDEGNLIDDEEERFIAAV